MRYSSQMVIHITTVPVEDLGFMETYSRGLQGIDM